MKLFGCNYNVKYVDDLEELGSEGISSSGKRTIYLASGATYERAASTMLHELIEVANAHLELELPHHVIACLETALFDALHSNGVSLKPLLPRQPKLK
jgi:hypothetical protein